MRKFPEADQTENNHFISLAGFSFFWIRNMVITSRFEEIVLYEIYVDFCQHEELNSKRKSS